VTGRGEPLAELYRDGGGAQQLADGVLLQLRQGGHEGRA